MKPDSDSRKDIGTLKNNFAVSNIVGIFNEQMEEVEKSRHSKVTQLLAILWAVLKESRNPWYYWYTGEKVIAIQAWVVSFVIMFGLAIIATGGVIAASVLVLVGVVLDNLALIALPIILLIDYYLPFPDSLYGILIMPIFISACGALITNRVAVFIVLHSGNE